MNIKKILVACLLVLAWPFLTGAQISLDEIENEVVNQVAPSVVKTEVQKRVEQDWRRVGSGSAFFISPDGYLLTNRHVVANEEARYIIDTGEDKLSADVIFRDPLYDLAILKVEGENYPTIELDRDIPEIGETVITIGNALGRYQDSVSWGEVSALDQAITPSNTDGALSGLIETSARVYPGDSGGPLLNEDGEVLGVNVATRDDTSFSYAIPAWAALDAIARSGIFLG